MKPDFALSLTFDGIALLLRGPDGWLRVGEVPLEAADLAGALADLRQRARALRPDGLLTKLIIPDAQIRYQAIETGAVDDRLRARLVRDALDGATPYAVEELVFDWQAEGARTHVAAVARETLEEAEAFALEHRFNPVAFVAAPQGGGFAREVSFGETASAGDFLARGARVERDAAPVRVTGDAPLPAPEAAGAEGNPSSASTSAGATHDPASGMRPPPADAPATGPDGTDAASPDAHPDASPAPAPEGGPRQGSATDAPPRPPGTAAEGAAAPPDGEAVPGPDEPPAATRGAPRRDTEPPRATAPRLSATPPSRGDAADRGQRTATDRPAIAPRGGTHSPEDTPAAPDPDAPAGPEEPRPGPQTPVPEFRSTRRAGGEDGPPPAVSLRRAPEARAHGAQPPRSEATPGQRPPPGTPTPEATARRDRILRHIAAAQAGAPDAGTGDAGTGPDADLPPQAAPPRAAAPAGPEGDEALHLTRFGERAARRGPDRRPRRRGARIAAVALVGVIGLGASAALLAPDALSRLIPGAPPAPVATVAPPPAPSVAETARDGPAGTTDAQRPTPSDARPTDTAPAARPDRPAEPPAPAPRPLDTDEAAARYAATGLWQKAPERPGAPAAGSLAGLAVAGIDAAVPAPKAGVLRPPERATDAPPESPAVPPPPGTVFDLDARGLVVATPEGALTPQGVRVIAGRPPVAPPERATPEERRAAEAARAAAARRAALEGLRPLARPAGLGPDDEEAEAPAEADPLAALDPPLRPGDITPEAPDATAEAPDGDDGAGRETVDGDAGTRQAVRASPEPAVRPGSLAEVVAAAPALPAPATAQSVAPDIPSNASVARAATEADAIDLRRVNLIGVYGEPANRRALVRLSDGRYEKVQVGDRLDGGRISAIGEDQLRYVKDGRNLVLRMPQG
ncbi:hypothetical protein DRV84_02270 [Rhodosalinus sediminis]|uniref:Translation initiation factor 2 n=1 Tax=Rhodosalinus sediminis TaxID=1940533 RepID=A0A3D9BYI3_9RHOB|nr:hypothetical protein [Rhodosalinus sediminis]REC58411.1 hypothetical protein DRV84_02270 [Rhodosalinus sediminis]